MSQLASRLSASGQELCRDEREVLIQGTVHHVNPRRLLKIEHPIEAVSGSRLFGVPHLARGDREWCRDRADRGLHLDMELDAGPLVKREHVVPKTISSRECNVFDALPQVSTARSSEPFAFDFDDKQLTLERTFLHAFEQVPGMAQAYRRWLHEGAAFHYVSASPWHLFIPLSRFMQRSKFPVGSLHLRDFRLKSSSRWNLLKSSMNYKIAIIEDFKSCKTSHFDHLG